MKLAQIAQKRDELNTRVLTPGYITTERDLSEAQELVSQYIDELERLENTVTVETGTDINDIAEKITQGWYPNGTHI